MRKFLVPEERFPKPFNQNIYKNGKLVTQVGSCVACSITKILEVINYVKTEKYEYLSKGYMYGRNNYPGKKGQGMNEEYTLNIVLKRGTVPESMCSDYDEIPDIVNKLEKRPDIEILDKEAEKYAIKGWEDISGNNHKQRFKNIEEYLTKHRMPLIGTIKEYHGGKHSVVLVDVSENEIYFLDHDGSDDIKHLPYKEFSKVYYLDGGIEMKKNNLPFADVKESDWFYDDIKVLYNEGIVNGKTENTIDPLSNITRAEVFAIARRILDNIKER